VAGAVGALAVYTFGWRGDSMANAPSTTRVPLTDQITAKPKTSIAEQRRRRKLTTEA
jgi:hypothetical protein